MLLQAVFITVIILNQFNIWVALIPHPTLTFLIVGFSLFWLGLLTNNFYLRKPKGQDFVALAVILITQLLPGMEGDERYANSYISIAGYVMLATICLGIISQWSQEQVRCAIKLYVVVSTVMAFLGFGAWLIVNFTWIYSGVIDPAHYVDLEQFTGGRMSRLVAGSVETTNSYGVDENTYSFPYLFGLVLTNSYQYELAGIPFFRASGWYHEPSTAWFMVIPPIILTASVSLFSENIRRALLTVQILFLISTFSVSIIIGLILVYVLCQIIDVLNSRSTLKSVALVCMVVSAFGVIAVLAVNYEVDPTVAMNPVMSKFASNDYVMIALNGTIFNPMFGLSYMYLSTVAILYLRKAIKDQDDSMMAFSLIVLCLLIVALKGSFYFLLINPGFYILFVLMLRHRVILQKRNLIRLAT